MFKKIIDFDEAYDIMEASFPISEIRPYEKIKELYHRELMNIYGYYDPEIKGAMIIWNDDRYVVIENFAVDRAARGEGVGSKMIHEVCEQMKDKTIVLEVEKPHDDISEKRIAFYEKNGFILSEFGYVQPKINAVVNTVPLILMVYNKRIDAEEFQEIKKMIFNSVYNETL
ncbi:ribosomal protein S18 acetylase RimI-like enzyme [Breznakia sp. PF5-3]|uniref:GNAT family N-acetyltransferase n=1 Tax=unclassified Breznakia TaxID=2623764 RepID=UPI00240574FC|nr:MULTISPECIES: GNAT family N-acetyltransferase [unclassified Breznakia]MDL2276440.1 GNAT family N-acetyltransferase [Breznakia sp. OttesenSCG-928-G09]MDF9825575.1 ribosomal protein S18 acetylase RimI-like enzyme [Breznakia sp. PM6-1]MDF9836434.1 ribosomal protein S18 acetylase RimI-like enzyme [Breznakia sp. PF5-3]MDF9838558.1 ribosomal protein S18 acetylase RimI-like enzyme [Breznakia sp. PFB2-8]MDF9860595.1 ribosomal protein S18 acetylase RimI-like enzyme [Breznakia sp. PH5-24]